MIKDRHKTYFQWGVTIFLVVVACILFFFCVLRFSELQSFFGNVVRILSPILWGVVIAYLLWPIVDRVRNFIIPVLPSFIKKEKQRRQIGLGIGIISALLMMILVIGVLLSMVLPELLDTTMNLINNLSTYAKTVETWIQTVLNDNPQFQTMAYKAFENVSEWLNNWVQTTLLPQINVVITGLTSSVLGFGKALLNFIIGIIVSVYIFISKDTFAGQFKKILYALFKPEHANVILDVLRHSHTIFGGFISGKILDSLIIGLLCFFSLSVLDMPYTLLVSVIVGVTNVIPFFGPFIGAIPSAFLILLVSPQKCLIFVIFILILQQIDGNIIGPTILGDSTGLSSFWIIFSILLFGGLFGFAGMILGVPICGVAYYITKRFVEYKLECKQYPTDTTQYSPAGTMIHPATHQIVVAPDGLPYPRQEEISTEDRSGSACAEEPLSEESLPEKDTPKESENHAN